MPDAQGSGVGVPVPLCASLALAEAVVQLLSEALKDSLLEALSAAVVLFAGEMVPPKAVEETDAVAKEEIEKKAAVAVKGGDAEAAREGEASGEGDAAAEPLPFSDALVVEEAVLAAEASVLEECVGEGPMDAVGEDVALLAAVADMGTVKTGEGDAVGVAFCVAVGEEEPLWHTLASADIEAVAVAAGDAVTVLEPDCEGEAGCVMLAELVPICDTDNPEVVLIDADRLLLQVPLEVAEVVAVSKGVTDASGVLESRREPERRGVEEGQKEVSVEPE